MHPLRRHLLLILTLLPAALAGCATHPISEPLRKAAAGQPAFAEVARDPAAHRGETIVASGYVLGAFPAKDGGTILEVLEAPSDEAGRPTDPDRSRGRFLVLAGRRLDPAVYRPGRAVAVGGPVVRAETREIPGGGTVTYPVVEARELHLFPVPRTDGTLPFSIGIGVGIGF